MEDLVTYNIMTILNGLEDLFSIKVCYYIVHSRSLFKVNGSQPEYLCDTIEYAGFLICCQSYFYKAKERKHNAEVPMLLSFDY